MKKRFQITGMTCAACQSHVEKAVRPLSGVKLANVNLLQNTMDVEYDEGLCSDEIICESVKNAGYGATLESAKKEEPKEKDNLLLSLIVSIAFLIILMYFSMGNMMWGWPAPKVFDMEECPMGFGLIQFILTLPILYLNRRYFINGYKRLFKGPNMDSLICVGATASMLYSVYCLFRIALDPSDSMMFHMSLYFEAAGMILVFVSIGKYLEGLSKRKTTKSLEKLMDLAPKTAILLKDGHEITVGIDQVKKGDILVVKKGALVPVDGILVKGSASIDQSNITGESIPVFKQAKDEVYASTMVSTGYFEMEATKVGKDTSIETIISLVEEASNSKAPISRLADQIAGIFVPLIFSISMLVFIGNLLYISLAKPSYAPNAFEAAFNYAVTVIVIACPCALGLATPVAIMVGTGKGAENGLLIKNAEILERAHQIKTIVFDKTGTITKGHPEVTDTNLDENALIALYSMEMKSEHPLSEAIKEYGRVKKLQVIEVNDYQSIEGKGLSAVIRGDSYYVGSYKDISLDEAALTQLNQKSDEGKTVLIVQKNDTYLGYIAIRDEIKESSKEAIEQLSSMGIDTIMLTGDNEKTASAIAKEIGITNVISEVLPKDKANVISDLKSKSNGLVAMVGDGVNDAPALTTADLGIAIGCGSDVAIESADIVLQRNDLYDVVNAICLSKRVIQTIKLGLFWAFFYNFICVLLATGIFYHITNGAFIMRPEYGSIAMSISSVSVVLNALTINLFKVKRTTIVEEMEEKEEIKMATLIIGVDGMMCKHCKAHVEAAAKKACNVTDAVASLEENNVTVTYVGSIDQAEVEKLIVDAGYEIRK